MQFVRHHSDRPHPCTICGKRFTQKAHLIIHKRTHTGEKPYPCHICHKRFAQSSHLAVHKRVHTGEKPFFCNFCGMGFCRRPRLEAHVLQHMVKEGNMHQQPMRPPPTAAAEMIAGGRGGANLNLNLNQESLDAAAQLMELKMKGGAGGIAIAADGGGGSFSQSQIKSEPLDAEERMRIRDGTQGSNNNNAVMINDLTSFNNKDIIDISSEDPKDEDILKLKHWANKSGGGEAPNEFQKFTTAGLTELNSVQQQTLNNSLVMPPPNSMLSPTHASSYHAAMAVAGHQNLTMSGLVRTNSRVSLIDFTAEDILQHLLSRDDIKSCEFCCLVFRDPAMYYLHRSMHDKMDIRCCNLCGKLLKDKYDFTAHYLNQHK